MVRFDRPTPPDLPLTARWAAEFERMREAERQARRLRWLPWRLRLTSLLVRRPFQWGFVPAFELATSLCGDAIHEMREHGDDMLTPRQALAIEVEHWDD